MESPARNPIRNPIITRNRARNRAMGSKGRDVMRWRKNVPSKLREKGVWKAMRSLVKLTIAAIIWRKDALKNLSQKALGIKRDDVPCAVLYSFSLLLPISPPFQQRLKYDLGRHIPPSHGQRSARTPYSKRGNVIFNMIIAHLAKWSILSYILYEIETTLDRDRTSWIVLAKDTNHHKSISSPSLRVTQLPM